MRVTITLGQRSSVGDVSLCFIFNEGTRALLGLLIEAFSLYETVAKKFHVISCWKMQQSDVNETTPVATLIDTKQQSATTRFNTQVATFSWHLCNRRDARVESHTHAKRTIIRKKLTAKLNIFTLNKTENTSRLFSSDCKNWKAVKLVEKSVALMGAWCLTQHRN